MAGDNGLDPTPRGGADGADPASLSPAFGKGSRGPQRPGYGGRRAGAGRPALSQAQKDARKRDREAIERARRPAIALLMRTIRNESNYRMLLQAQKDALEECSALYAAMRENPMDKPMHAQLRRALRWFTKACEAVRRDRAERVRIALEICNRSGIPGTIALESEMAEGDRELMTALRTEIDAMRNDIQTNPDRYATLPQDDELGTGENGTVQ